MEQKDIKLIEELKTKADEAAERIEELSDDIKDVETDRDDYQSALEDCRASAEAITADNWEEKASEIIERVKGVL